jgi:hypothetical protein
LKGLEDLENSKSNTNLIGKIDIDNIIQNIIDNYIYTENLNKTDVVPLRWEEVINELSDELFSIDLESCEDGFEPLLDDGVELFSYAKNYFNANTLKTIPPFSHKSITYDFCQICILNVIEGFYICFTEVLPFLVTFYSHEASIWYNNYSHNFLVQFTFIIYDTVKIKYCHLYYWWFFCDHIINSMPLKFFYFQDWCQYLLATPSDLRIHLHIDLPEAVLFNTKTSQKQNYILHDICKIVYEATDHASNILVVFFCIRGIYVYNNCVYFFLLFVL